MSGADDPGGVAAPLPCAIFTGALGAGKTTLIRDLLRRPEMADTALVVNEFGEVALDHILMASAVETTVLMENGCLCCSLRGDAVDTINQLFADRAAGRIPPFRRILIETTGLADPGPIVRDIAGSPALEGKVRGCEVLVAVDALNGMAALAGDGAAVSQITHADQCFLTKCDLADPLAVDVLRDRLSSLNPAMEIRAVRGGRLPEGARLFEAAGRIALPHPVPDQSAHDHAACDDPAHDHAHGGHHDHHHPEGHHDAPAGTRGDHLAEVQSWSTILPQRLPWALIRDWLDHVYSLRGAQMLRAKGLVWIEERDLPLLFQAVGPGFMPLDLMPGWPPGPRETRLVLIFRGIEAAAVARSFARHVLAFLPRAPEPDAPRGKERETE